MNLHRLTAPTLETTVLSVDSIAVDNVVFLKNKQMELITIRNAAFCTLVEYREPENKVKLDISCPWKPSPMLISRNFDGTYEVEADLPHIGERKITILKRKKICNGVWELKNNNYKLCVITNVFGKDLQELCKKMRITNQLLSNLETNLTEAESREDFGTCTLIKEMIDEIKKGEKVFLKF
jgi:hypothetical protein